MKTKETMRQKLLNQYAVAWWEKVYYKELLHYRYDLKYAAQKLEMAEAVLAALEACLSETDKKQTLPTVRTKEEKNAKAEAMNWVNSHKYM